MHNLLIHNDNTPFIKSFKSSIQFSASSDIDNYISTDIIPKIKAKTPDIIFIKDNLSSNYLELYGFRLAYHVRFEEKLKFVPIVILSDLDGFTLNRLESSAKILFTQNIFIIENSKKAFDDFDVKKMKSFNEENYKSKFLDLISVEAPENSSSHSIANEWAIYRWSKYLKVESEAIIKNREKIASMLYFKYLLAKNPIEIKKKNGIQFVPRPPENSGKILYIDDEWAKGWSDVFEQYFSKNKNIEFETFEYDFKENNKFTMISSIKNRCLAYNPDVVILDLRLTQSDHESIDVNNLTGIKITEIIKEINPAIQIIMLTATGKSTILENLYQHGILGYIKKEHPADIGMSTKESFDKLKTLVDKGLDKKYLKEVWEIQQSIKPFSPDIKIEVDSVFEILNSDMKNRFIYAMFAIFKVIEIINDKYFEDGYKKATWKDTNEEILDNSTKNKIQLILNKRLHLNNQKVYEGIENIIKIRNNTIHPKHGKIEIIQKDSIIEWFKMLQTILEKIEK
ncbi:MAG: Unknown protein [uncultured Sulfurovum sp.]|uniref:Uncharacterized protein n=1 Tax=uncultured Sulfurovum sp. TaxID=269237 RepID=A0A6S6SID6_9BACT|nr:MAG: Unknown protein [uncultured Sulfurovum sp.]